MLLSRSPSAARCASVTLQTRTLACRGMRSPSSMPSIGAIGAASRARAWRAGAAASSAWVVPLGFVGASRVGLSTLSDQELRSKMNEFNDLFVTAREEMEFAGESKDTTYFDEEAAAAKEAVDEAVGLFEEVLKSVDEKTRNEIMRGSGLRVEQLKAELDQLLESDDH